MKITMISILLLCFTLTYAQNFKILSQTNLDDNSSVSLLRYDRDEYGIGILNNKGVMTKELPLDNKPIDLGILGDNIIVICAKLKKNIKTIGFTAVSLNKRTLALVNERELYFKENASKISTTLLKDPNNRFCYVIFRETNYDEGFQMLGPTLKDTKYLESSSIKLISLNEKLNEKVIDIKTDASSSYFAGACSDYQRNIYICSFTSNLISVEKFDSLGIQKGKLATDISVGKTPNLIFKMNKDKDYEGFITVALNYFNAEKGQCNNVLRFDFSSNKVIKAEEIALNKDYRKSLKNVNEEAKGRNFAYIDFLKLNQLLEDSNRIVVVKEIKRVEFGGKNEATSNIREGSIITIYNKKALEEERNIVFDKRFITFVEMSDGIAAYLTGNNMWVVTCELTGIASFRTYTFKINLSTGDMTKEEIEKDDIGKSWVTFPSQVAWFKNSFIVPFFKVSSPFKFSFESELVVRKY